MQLLSGRYETLRAIASGGMATVHLGRAVGVGGFERLVAIKVMHSHIAEDPEFVDMFLDEARLAARIRHPNVVATIDVRDSKESLFLVMELVDGPSLRRLLKKAKGTGDPLPLGVTVRVMLDTLAGLQAAHELTGDDGEPLQLIHRDVTPANILVGVDGVVRLTDFGVARAEARLSSTRGGQLKGKIPYMPPEQLLGDPMDHRCDVYAAGAVLWETLVGRRLYRADSDGRLVKMIISGPELTPRKANPRVPPAIDRVCMAALESSPEDRHATAAAFAEALEEAAEKDGIAIATNRAVAAYVEQSGAHKKLDPKELAALRRGEAGGAPTEGEPSAPSSPSAKGSSPAIRRRGASAEPAAGDDGPAAPPETSPAATPPPEEEESSLPSVTSGTDSSVSSLTATEHVISGTPEPLATRPKRTGMVLGVLAATAVIGAVIALLVLPSDESGVPASDGDDRPAVSAAPPAETTAAQPESVTEPPAAAADDAPAASGAPTVSASAAATASASASVAAPPPTPGPTRPIAQPKPKPTQTTKPRPGSTSYNPPKL